MTWCFALVNVAQPGAWLLCMDSCVAMFDVAVAMLFLLFCHPGPARVFCLFAFCIYSASVTLRRDVGTAGMHV